MSTSQRIHWIDISKGIAIFLVVLGHSGPSYYYYTLYYIHLPIFIVISGYLLGYSKSWRNMTIRDNIRKKAADIMYPYVIFGIIFTLFNTFKSLIVSKSMYDILYSYAMCFEQVVLLENTSNWFLPPLFFAEVLFIIIHKFLKDRKGLLTLIIILLIPLVEITRQIMLFSKTSEIAFLATTIYYLFLYLGRSLSFLIYVTLGYLLFLLFENPNGALLFHKKLSIAISTLILLVVVHITKNLPMADLHFLYWNSTLLYFVMGMLGSTSCIILLFLIQPKNCLIEYIGKNTLIINGLHLGIELISGSRMLLMLILSSKVYNLLSPTLITTLICCITCLTIMIIFVPLFNSKRQIASTLKNERPPKRSL